MINLEKVRARARARAHKAPVELDAADVALALNYDIPDLIDEVDRLRAELKRANSPVGATASDAEQRAMCDMDEI